MPGNATCSRCGGDRPGDGPAGLCPRCLLMFGLDLGPAGRAMPAAPHAGGLEGGRSFRTGPASETGAFPGPGILDSLDGSIGPVPRVLLRDGPADDARPVRPGSEEMPELAGEAVRYQLLGEVARGGMGAILKGRDVDLGRDLAIKVLLEKHRDHPEMVRRFVEEAQIGGQLQHPGIVPVHELGRFPDGRLFIAMKLVKGRTLAALLESRTDPAEDRPRFLSIFQQVCQTMAYAHARGVIHRDLKPSNVMVGSFGEVQVMDWGLAKVLDQGGLADEERSHRMRDGSGTIRTMSTGSAAAESIAGSVIGTPAYMPPEQARGAMETLDERADVFGLGSILCEILTGEPAYTGASSVELYRKAERADLAGAIARLDGCGADAELVALARSCLAAAPRDRPRDAGVVAAGLAAHLAGVEQRLLSAGLAQARAEARAAEERKRRILAVGLAATVLVAVTSAATGWAWVSRDRSARVSATIAAVNGAMFEAERRREAARAAAVDVAAARWVEAIEAARRAEALAGGMPEDPDLRLRARNAVASIARERDDCIAAEKDRRMVERLVAIHDDLGVHMDAPRAESEYAAAFRDYGVDVEASGAREAGERLAASPVAVELAGAMDQWIFIRRGQNPPDVDGIQQLLAVAKAADPDPWRNRLRDALGRDALGRRGMQEPSVRETLRETLRRLAADANPENLPEASVTRLAFALSGADVELAISLLARAQRIHPDDFWLNADLARQLLRTGRLEEAIRFYSVAVAIRPRSGIARNGLADALHRSGRLDEAAATFRRAVRLRPDDVWAIIGLGAVLLDRGSMAEARAQFREAEAIRPDDGWIRDQIAQVLAPRGELDAAIDESREAVRREPDSSMAHHHLGQALLEAGRVFEAIEAFRAAIRLDGHPGPARDDLGRALLAAGELEEALRWLQRPRREGPSEPGRRRGKDHSSDPAVGVAEVQRLLALEARLPGVLRGVDKPAGAAECAEFARLAALKHHYATAARLWRQAFAADPALADDFPAQRRFRAACAAAMAGGPDDRDRSTLDETSRRDWLRQAGEWLEAELRAYDRMRSSGTPQDRAAIVGRLGSWQVAPALAALRDAADPADTKDAQHNSRQDLWLDVATLKERILRTGAVAASPSHPLKGRRSAAG